MMPNGHLPTTLHDGIVPVTTSSSPLILHPLPTATFQTNVRPSNTLQPSAHPFNTCTMGQPPVTIQDDAQPNDALQDQAQLAAGSSSISSPPPGVLMQHGQSVTLDVVNPQMALMKEQQPQEVSLYGVQTPTYLVPVQITGPESLHISGLVTVHVADPIVDRTTTVGLAPHLGPAAEQNALPANSLTSYADSAPTTSIECEHPRITRTKDGRHKPKIFSATRHPIHALSAINL